MLRLPRSLRPFSLGQIGLAEDDISADDLNKAAGGSLKEYLRIAIINTSE
jgi:hypothetical protein